MYWLRHWLKYSLALVLMVLLFFNNAIPLKVNAETKVSVTYDSHVQNIGWKNENVSDGIVSGTTGQSLRMEAVKVKLANPVNGMTIRYQVHTQNLGWLPWVKDGQEAGTTGQSLRAEAIKIELINAPSEYHVYYQVHSQNMGWLPWVKDGEEAGTTGKSLRMEAIRIKVIKNGEAPPTDVPPDGNTYTLPSATNENKNRPVKKIGIDIGHNVSFDIGAKGYVLEDNVNKEVGKVVIEKLTNLGYVVIDCTPKTAYSLSNSLQQRVDKANKNNVDFYVSIHHNKFDGNANGTEIYTYNNAPLARKVADNVLKKIVELGYKNRGVKNANYFVLKNTNAPAILIECCFIDSPSDMARYNSGAIADKIVEGIENSMK